MAFGGETAESYYDDGLTAFMRGEIRQATTCFERAIELDEKYFAAYHQLARCAMRQGDLKRAVELLTHVIRNRPRLIPPRIDLGHVCIMQGRVDEAHRMFTEIIGVEPTNARALFGLAQVAFERAQWADAVAFAQRSLEHSGPYFPALFLLGKAARLADDPQLSAESLEQAGALVEKSLELNPDQPESHYMLGEVRFARERFNDALESYREAADRSVADRVYTAYNEAFTRLDALAKQALCYQRLGERARANEIAEGILQTDPNHRMAQVILGRA